MEKLLYDKYIDTLLVLAEVAKTGDERAKQYLTDLIVKMEPDIRRSVVSLFNDFSGLSYTRNKNVLKSYKFDIEDSSNSKHRSFYTRRLKLLQQGESEFYKQRDLCRFIYNCYFNAKDKIKEYDETYFEKNFDAIYEYCETEFNTRDFFNYLNLIGCIADRETYDGGLVSAINFNKEQFKNHTRDGRIVNRFNKTRDIWRHIFVSESFKDEKTIYIEINASYLGKSRTGKILFDKNYGFNISRSNGIQYTEEDLPVCDCYAYDFPDDKKERYFLNENYENFVINYITKSFKEHIKQNSATSIKTKKTIQKESGLSQ